jgi:membrane protein DedA with SNARE-associated domain
VLERTIERIADALGFELPKEQKPIGRFIVFAMIGGVLFSALAFIPLFVATAVIWPSAQGPLLAFAIAPVAFAVGTVVGALSAWRNEK